MTSGKLQVGSSVLFLAAMTVVFAASTFARNAYWKDEFTIFADVNRKTYSKLRSHVILGRLHYLSGRPYDAIKEYLWVLERDKSRYDINNNLGVIYMALNRLDDAEREIAKAVGKKKLNGDPDLNMGNIYYAKGELVKAEEWYKRAAEINPKNHLPLENVGFVYIDMKRYGAAIDAFSKAARLSLNPYNAYYGLALSYDSAGDYASALKYWREFVSLAPSTPGYGAWLEHGRERIRVIESMRTGGQG